MMKIRLLGPIAFLGILTIAISGIDANLAFADSESTKNTKYVWLEGIFFGTADSGWDQCWIFSIKGNKINGGQIRSKDGRTLQNSLSGEIRNNVAVITVHTSRGMEYTVERNLNGGLVSTHESGAMNYINRVDECPIQ